MDRRGKVLKIPISPDRVLLKAGETIRRESQTEAEAILAEAHAAAARIRKEALEAAQEEREKAEQEARAIREEAENNRDALIHEASANAREQARKEVLEEFRPRVEEAIGFLERTVQEAEEAWHDSFSQHKSEVVELALSIAEKVVHKISQEDRELVKRTAEAALAQAKERQEVLFRVHPEDLSILEDYQIELITKFEGLQAVRIEQDTRVDRGGIEIETGAGFVDARIRTQLDEMMETVLPKHERSDSKSQPPETGVEELPPTAPKEEPPTPESL